MNWKENKPNIILIIIDSLRHDHLSINGYFRKTSTFLDGLASKGVNFTRAYANAAWTKASVATILTSLYPSSHQTNEIDDRLPDSISLFLPEVLRESGFKTSAFSGIPFLSPLFGFGRGFDFFYSSEKEDLSKDKIDAKDLNKKALNWLRAVAGRPFFLYIHYVDTHSPYIPPGDYKYLYHRLNEEPTTFWNSSRNDIAKSSEKIHSLISQYDAEIKYVDDQIKLFFEKLRKIKALDNTLIIVTSDHGEEFYEHSFDTHIASLYEAAVRIPLIMVYNKSLPENLVSEIPISHVDIMPTILEIIGIDVNRKESEGESVIPAIQGDYQNSKRIIIEQLYHQHPIRRAIISDRFKLIATYGLKKSKKVIFMERMSWIKNKIQRKLKPYIQKVKKIPSKGISPLLESIINLIQPAKKQFKSAKMQNLRQLEERQSPVLELYDISTDPEEKLNLINKMPFKTKQLNTEIDRFRSRSQAKRRKQSKVVLDEKTTKQLKALGYLD